MAGTNSFQLGIDPNWKFLIGLWLSLRSNPSPNRVGKGRLPMLYIQRFCDGPYVELFARTRHPGFEVWGNEPDLFGEAA